MKTKTKLRLISLAMLIVAIVFVFCTLAVDLISKAKEGGDTMKQIIINYLGLFIVPALVGFTVRFLLLRSKKGYLVTEGVAILTLISWVAANVIPTHGSEVCGVLTLMVTSAAVASFVTGLVI